MFREKPLSRMYLQLCAGCTVDHSGSFYCLNLFAFQSELLSQGISSRPASFPEASQHLLDLALHLVITLKYHEYKEVQI